MTNKVFENEWIFDSFTEDPTFYTKRMFGGLAVYLHGRQMLLLVEPTKNGRWDWHGVLICTSKEFHQSLSQQFSNLEQHEVLKKWLFIDSSEVGFEDTLKEITRLIESNDQRIGIWPKIK